jgi:hypothetical protein
MRFFISAAIIPVIFTAVPALAVPAHSSSRTLAQCEVLAVQRQSGPGMAYHRRFIRECLAGKLTSERLSMTYDECERLSEERGAGSGGPGHMTACMAQRVARTARRLAKIPKDNNEPGSD